MSETMEQVQWLSIQQTADRWNVSYETVRREVLSGKLPHMRVRSSRRIPIEVIEERERAAKQLEISAAKKSAKRVAAFVSSGKDHYPDC